MEESINPSSHASNDTLLATFPNTPYVVIPSLSPMYNNILAALLTILYVKTVMEVGNLIRVKYDLPELSRKFIHLCACSLVVFWPLFDSQHWGWRLNVTVPVVMSLRLFYKVSR